MLASKIRSEIRETTLCNASIGISHNVLLARLANKDAKPNGQLYIEKHQVDEFMKGKSVESLHGIGYSSAKILRDNVICICESVKQCIHIMY